MSTPRALLPAGRDLRIGGAGDNQLGIDVSPIWAAASTAGAAIGAYHGFKRNDSVGWAIGWGVLGAMFPIFVIPIALAQGLGKKA